VTEKIVVENYWLTKSLGGGTGIWVGVKAVLWIAYNNQKHWLKHSYI
jgi:hypothetical protein